MARLRVEKLGQKDSTEGVRMVVSGALSVKSRLVGKAKKRPVDILLIQNLEKR